MVSIIMSKDGNFCIGTEASSRYINSSGDIFSLEMSENIFKDEGEYHAFWDNAFSGIGVEDNTTFLISAPTFGGSPVGVDFFETRRRNIVFDDDVHEYDYDPYGVLIPLVKYQGSGFFHCNNS